MDNEFYDGIFEQYGEADVRSLGWGSKASQEARFTVLAREATKENLSGVSVLDVGCGYGDIVPRIAMDIESYTGIDARAEVVQVAEERWMAPQWRAEFHALSLADYVRIYDKQFSVVVASGMFGRMADSHMFAETLFTMWELAKRKVVVNFLKLQDGKVPQAGVYYTCPAMVLGMIGWPVKHIEIIGGYLPNDFTVVLHK